MSKKIKAVEIVPVEDSPPFGESLGDFMARVGALEPLGWFVEQVLPEDSIVLLHGHPRSMKTLFMMNLGLTLAAGLVPFGYDKFVVKGAARVMHLSEEDPERLFHERFGQTLARYPDETQEQHAARLVSYQNFFPIVRQGISLDEDKGQSALLKHIEAAAPEVLTLDPLRGVTSNCDKGPSELHEFVRFLRKISSETSVQTVGLVHHDVKPPVSQRATGKQKAPTSYSASGGGIFSVCDTIIGFQKQGKNTCMGIPSDYKTGHTPSAFRITYLSEGNDDEGWGKWVKPVIQTVSEQEMLLKVRQDKVFLSLKENAEADGWVSVGEIRGASGSSKERILKELEAAGRIRQPTEEERAGISRSKRASLWKVIEEDKEPK